MSKDTFLYNPKTHTLHIKGYCHYTQGCHPEYLPFDKENGALAYDGRAVGMCKLCQKARDRKMEK